MQVQNPEIGQYIRDAAKITLAEGFPQNISPTIQGIIDLSPKLNKRLKSASAVGTTSASSNTILAASESEKYVTGMMLSFVKDSTCDVASGSISISLTQEGDASSTTILRLAVLTLTAQERALFVNLPNTIKIKKNTAISISQGTFTVGNFVRCASVYYYED